MYINAINSELTESGQRLEDLVIGIITGVNPGGLPCIAFMDNQTEEPMVSRTVVTVSNRDIGRRVVVMFESGDIASPVILGLIQEPYDIGVENEELAEVNKAPSVVHDQNKSSVKMELPDKGPAELFEEVVEELPDKIVVDADALHFNGSREIRLECGEASISLTRAGKIIIKGAEIVTRSTGSNRIKGVSVEIN